MVFQFILLPLVMATACYGSPEQFLMDIAEMGWEFTETVSVDEEANTVRIQVPHHNEVEATTYIHDFNKNLTLSIIEDTGACYLTDLAAMLDHGYMMRPKQLKKKLKANQVQTPRANQSNSSEVVTVVEDWTYGAVLTEAELDSLSQEMRDACEKSSIRWLIRLKDYARVRNSEAPSHATRPMHLASRQRRQLASCSRDNLKFRCRREIKSCQYIFYENCESARGSRETRNDAVCVGRDRLHLLSTIQCCRECCMDQSTSDTWFPYCIGLEVNC